jgi:hypothetical protein
MKIEWEKILTNAISALVTMIFVGACVVVWQGATTVDTKVQKATENTKSTIEYVQKLVEVVQEEMADIKNTQNDQISTQEDIKSQLSEQLLEIKSQIEKLNLKLYESSSRSITNSQDYVSKVEQIQPLSETQISKPEHPQPIPLSEPVPLPKNSRDFIRQKLPELKYKD